MPKWAGGKQPALDLQQKRVFDILQRYSGRMQFWEVVNEPSHLPGFKIDDRYRWARQADPTAYLIVNDYHVMADGHPPFFQLLKRAIDNGVPFDGIGTYVAEIEWNGKTTEHRFDLRRDALNRVKIVVE